jgi:hypothetical protein
MPTNTAGQIITSALMDLGVVAEDGAPSAAQLANGLRRLNQLLAGWSVSGLLVPALTIEEIAFSTAQMTYTVGAGGEIDTTRPMSIHSAQYKTGENIYYPLAVLTDAKEWGDIELKPAGGYPESIYYNPTYPLGKLYFDTLPAVGAMLALTSWKPLTQFADKDAEWDGPLEYVSAMEYSLAVMMGPSSGADPAAIQLAAGLADNFLNPIKTALNAKRVPVLDRSDSGGRGYNAIYDR